MLLQSGCSLTQQETTSQQNEENSYVPYVIIDDDIYYPFKLNEGKYTKGEVKGEVIKKVLSSDTIEIENLTSNYYNEGTLIYTVIEDKEYLIIEEETGDEILKRYE